MPVLSRAHRVYAPALVCHGEVVGKCDAEQAAGVKAWLEKVMIEGIHAILNSVGEEHVPTQVGARIASSWREGG
jgi:hypothetical protein